MKSNRERAFFFEKPDVIPMTFHMNSACWNFYPQDWICEMFETHPILFPGYRRPEFPVKPLTGMNNSKDHPYTDDFGCTWTTAIDGITGTVTGHPLADWGNYKNYRFPDPAVMEIGDNGAAMKDMRGTPAMELCQQHMAELTGGTNA